MKNILIQYKPFFVFLAKFFVTYLLLSLLYSFYLSNFDASKNELDGVSKFVASNVNEMLLFFNQDVSFQYSEKEPAAVMFFNGKSVSRIIEGCNAVSVMLLFVAFIVAFSSNFKHTFFYILLGLVLIHFMNIARIAFLNYSLFYYPEQKELLHDIVFPLIIYGSVFLLWILWVLKFSGYAKK
ncbi:exosortase family protein XrtF [Flavobacterium sp.]|uniref:exosortase family protein XrtF n=1 Tax=Flavobacterium sp. TaxID=239 RepID=UPI003F695C9B